MCLAVPGEVLEIDGDTATVDFEGAEREVKLDLLEDVSEGDYVLVHTGFAIQVLSPEEAEETLDSWEEVAEMRTSAGV
ncbi:hydrogenase [candidate division MSBL1 archaeon SCGC-AAA382C18]|uniref:Hydrogenase n=1 Tax=candidate division MSBL1 archaeon SCGC-AAA382C18 TaxID=1698281 RepID=A0A133VIE4_9EURY|nr:hydrogenase [candidate division MSBL1 archaeon SCGC-AAA382C18]